MSKFSKNWGYGGLIMVNLFAYRSTDPSMLKSTSNIDPVGPMNDKWIIKLQRKSKLVVVAWGVYGCLNGRDRHVLNLLTSPYCLDVTKKGHPKHPLYIRANTRLKQFKIRTI